MENCFSNDAREVAKASRDNVRITADKIAASTGWSIERVYSALAELERAGAVTRIGDSDKLFSATAKLPEVADLPDFDGDGDTGCDLPDFDGEGEGGEGEGDNAGCDLPNFDGDTGCDVAAATKLVNALPKRVEDPLAAFMAAVEALPHLEVIEGDALEIAKGETVDKISAVADAWNKLFEELATRKTVRTIDPRNEVVSVSTVEAGVKGTYSFRGRERIAFFPKWPKPATGEGLERMVAEAKAGCEHHAAYVLAYATGKIEVHGKPKGKPNGKPNGKPKGKPKAKPAAVSSPNADTLTPSVADIIKSALGQ